MNKFSKKFNIKIKKRYIISIAIIIGVIIVFVVGKQQQDGGITYIVKRADISDQLLLAGTIDAEKRVNLGFASSGRVQKNNYEVGDYVKKGEVIAEIDQNNLQSNLIQAQASYNLTKVDTTSNLDGAQSGYDNQLAEQNSIVEGLYGQYLSTDLVAYLNDNDDTEKQAPIISGSYLGDKMGDYVIDLYKSASSSGYSFKLSGLENGTYTGYINQPGKLGEFGLYIQLDADTNYANTEWVIPVPNTRSATYLARKTAYENSLKTRDRILTDAENNLNRLATAQGGSDISRSEAQKNQARAQVSAVYAQLNNGKIVAPFDGIIARNDLEIGEIVSAYTPAVVLFANNNKELNLNVPEIYINKIELGDSVNISLDAYSEDIFSGVVSFIDFINTEVDGVPVYKTEILLNNDDPRIRVGMNAKASIISDERKQVIAIPKHYIKDGFVQLQKNNETHKTSVEIGLNGNEGLVEIISGLNEGDIISPWEE